jgi:hypothetical protein
MPSVLVTSSNVAATTAALQSNAVDQLQFSGGTTGVTLSDLTPAFWAAVSRCSSFTHISINPGGNLGDAGLQTLASALFTNIYSKNLLFAFQAGGFTDVGANAIANLIRNGPSGLVNSIFFNSNPLITDASGVNLMAAAPFLTGSQILLAFPNCGLSDLTAAAFANFTLAQNEPLWAIDLSNNNISNVGAGKILDALRSNQAIQYILLDRNPGITNASLLTEINSLLSGRNAACGMVPASCPIVKKATLAINPYGLTPVTASGFAMTDVNGNPLPVAANAYFVVNATSGGHFALSSLPGVALTRFSVAQMNAGLIVFNYTAGNVSTGVFPLPSFSLSGMYNNTFFTLGMASGAVSFSAAPTAVAATTAIQTAAPTEAPANATQIATSAIPATQAVTNATQAMTSTTAALTQAMTQAAATPTSSSATVLNNATTAVTQALTNATTALAQAIVANTTLSTQPITSTTIAQTQSLTHATTALTEALTNATRALTAAATAQASATATTASSIQGLTTASAALTQAMTNASAALTQAQTTANATSAATQALATATTHATQTLTMTATALAQVLTNATSAATTVAAIQSLTNATAALTQAATNAPLVNNGTLALNATHLPTIAQAGNGSVVNASAVNATNFSRGQNDSQIDTDPTAAAPAVAAASGLGASVIAGIGGGIAALIFLIVVAVICRYWANNKPGQRAAKPKLLALTGGAAADPEAAINERERLAIAWTQKIQHRQAQEGSPYLAPYSAVEEGDHYAATYAACNPDGDEGLYLVPVVVGGENHYDAALDHSGAPTDYALATDSSFYGAQADYALATDRSIYASSQDALAQARRKEAKASAVVYDIGQNNDGLYAATASPIHISASTPGPAPIYDVGMAKEIYSKEAATVINPTYDVGAAEPADGLVETVFTNGNNGPLYAFAAPADPTYAARPTAARSQIKTLAPANIYDNLNELDIDDSGHSHSSTENNGYLDCSPEAETDDSDEGKDSPSMLVRDKEDGWPRGMHKLPVGPDSLFAAKQRPSSMQRRAEASSHSRGGPLFAQKRAVTRGDSAPAKSPLAKGAPPISLSTS